MCAGVCHPCLNACRHVAQLISSTVQTRIKTHGLSVYMYHCNRYMRAAKHAANGAKVDVADVRRKFKELWSSIPDKSAFTEDS